MKNKPRRKPKDPEWQRLSEMPEPARTSPHRPYWVCARFLCAMHALSTCSRWLHPTREREVGVSCNAVVELGVGVAEKRGPRHLEVFNLAYEYSEFEQPVEAGLLVGLRNELVIEERDRWDMLTERERAVLKFIAESPLGVGSGEIADSLGRGQNAIRCFKPANKDTKERARPDRVGKALLRDLCKRGLLVTEGKGGHLRYKLHHKPAGWPE